MLNFFSKMLQLLPGAINTDGANVNKLVRFFADAFGDIWGVFLKISDFRNIDNAKGALLDALGKKYGVERGQADDAFFRLMLKSKIAARKGDATVNGILATIQNALGVPVDGVQVVKIDGEPNAIAIMNVPLDVAKTAWERRYLLGRIEATAAAGIRVDRVEFVDNAGATIHVLTATRSTLIINTNKEG